MKKFILFLLIFLLVGCSKNVIMEDPDQIIQKYAKAIFDGDTKVLVELYGGDYGWMAGFSLEEERDDIEKIFKNYLKVIPRKIYFNEISEKEVVSEYKIIYTITFRRQDDSLFDVGDTQNRNNRFLYTFMKVNFRYKVMDPPPYQT